MTLITLLSCDNGQKNDLSKINLQGDIKQIRTSSYVAGDAFGKLERKRISGERENSQIIFDKKGNREQAEIYSQNGKLIRKYTYAYNDKGLRSQVSQYSGRGELSYKYISEYDEKENRSAVTTYDGKGNISTKTTFKYDEKNNIIEETEYKGDGSILWKTNFKYDDKGNNIEKERYKFDGKLLHKYVYSYDEKNNVSEEMLYGEKGNLERKSRFAYTYDSAGNWIQCIEYINENPKFIVDRAITYHNGDTPEISPTSYYVGGTFTKPAQVNDWLRKNLNGEVASIIEIEFYASKKFGKIIQGSQKSDYTMTFFNEEGRIKQYNTYDKRYGKDARTREIYSFNKKGFPTQSTTYDSYKDITEIKKFKIDENGNILESKSYSKNGYEKDELHEEYTYDERGLYLTNSGYEYYFEYTYDDNGYLISIKGGNDGVHEIYSYKNDEYGNPLEVSLIGEGEMNYKYKTFYTYQYDEQGNWIKRFEDSNGDVSVTQRIIKYY